MSGLEKIIEDIRKESESTIAEIRNRANKEASDILEKANEEAEKSCSAVRKETERKIRDSRQRALSASELARRKKLLSTKQELISDTIEEALNKISELPEEAYFGIVIKMAAENAHVQESGEIFFSEKDLLRLPSDFEKRLNTVLTNGSKLSVSAKAADIKNGFILSYGGIEENCSFEAVFNAKHEEMQDKVCKILFS